MGGLGRFVDRMKLHWLYVIIATIAVLTYLNTLQHDYVLDDALMITDNAFTKKGVAGLGEIFSHDTFYGFFQKEGKEQLVSGGRYRPLTQAMFAMEYEFFGANPFFGHLFNVIWYAFCCCTVLFFFHALLKEHHRMVILTSFIAALLFTVHPIHTEVVANIKGRDEIMALLLSLWAAYFSLRAVHKRSWRSGVTASALFFLAMMAKENAVSFLGITPVAAILLLRKSWGEGARSALPLCVGLGVYIVLRTSILGWNIASERPMELMNNPFVEVVDGGVVPMPIERKVPTIIYGLGKYLQLSIFPHPLTHDYYPRHIEVYDWSSLKVWISLLLVLGLLGLSATWSRPILTFGIIYFFLALLLVSNIFFPIGTNLSERFLFMPSVGVALILGWFLVQVIDKWSYIPLWLILLVLVVLAGYKSIERNRTWNSNFLLFTTDVQTSSGSAKVQNAAGGTLIDHARNLADTTERNIALDRAIGHLRSAVDIHPLYKNAYLLLGNAHFYRGDLEEAISFYDHALQIDDDYQEARTNRAIAQRDLGRWYGEKRGDINRALSLLEEAIPFIGDDYEANRLLGIAYGNKGDAENAVKYFTKALSIKPNDGWSHYNLGLAYLSQGDSILANRYLTKAKSLNPKIDRR